MWTDKNIPSKYKNAGSITLSAIKQYCSLEYSTIRKAAVLIVGGIIWQPLDAEPSTSPVNSFLKPFCFISGIVIELVETVFPIEEP